MTLAGRRNSALQVERIIAYLERRERYAAEDHQRFDSWDYHGAARLVFETFYGPPARPIASPLPAISSPPANPRIVTAYQLAAREKPFRRVVGARFYWEAIPEVGEPFSVVVYLLECGHVTDAGEVSHFGHFGKRRRCEECKAAIAKKRPKRALVAVAA